MNKINEIGEQLIEYKHELMKDYPEIVTNSLNLALEKMMDSGVIDMYTLEVIRNQTEGKGEFTEYLKTRAEFTKSYEELFEEYEAFRIKIMDDLRNYDILGLSTEIAVERDAILVNKTFSLNEVFVMDYFGVPERDLVKLMKKGGFVELFVTLRLIKVVDDIIKECTASVSHLKLDRSFAYFNSRGDGYNVDLILEIKIEDLEKESRHGKIMSEIKTVSERAEEIYKGKMIN